MSTGHPDIGPELRRVAQAILDGIDPVVRAAAALTAGGGAGTGKCQQVWCPVCALAALTTGDQHPLLTIVADHSAALVEVLRTMVSGASDSDGSAKPPPDGPPGPPGNGSGADTDASAAAARTRYQPIPVTVEE